MTEAFDILTNVGDLLQVLILTVVEDRIVDDYAVNGIVDVGSKDVLFKVLTVNFSQFEIKTAVNV